MKIDFSKLNIREMVAGFISDPENVQLCRTILGEEMLKPSKVSNWRVAPDSIPDATVIGGLFGYIYARHDEDKRNALGTAPLSLSRMNRRDLEVTKLWADSVWHIVQIETDGTSRVWRRWNGVRPLYERTPAWLTHSSRVELFEGASPPASIGSGLGELQVVMESVSGKPQANIRFLQQISEPCNAGYQFTSNGAFASSTEGGEGIEFFAGQSVVPSTKSVVLVNLPREWILPSSFSPSGFGLSFAPVSVANPIRHVREIMNLGVSGNSNPTVSYAGLATWMQKIAVNENIRSEDLQRFETIPGLSIRRESHVTLLAEFEFPNPLSYDAIFWRLPTRAVSEMG